MTTANRHNTFTALELTRPMDTYSVTHASPPELENASTQDVAVSNTKARNDPCGEDQAPDEVDHADGADNPRARVGRFSWNRIVVYCVLPGLALFLALGAGYLKWQDGLARLSQTAAVQSVPAATESTIAMLTYRPDTADRELTAAADRLTGKFRDDYTKLINDVVIPGTRQKQISSIATVPAAASISATENHATVLVFVNQTTIIGNDPPTNSISSVRVTLDKVQNRWLISQFDPV